MRIEQLTFTRFIAAVAIVIFHYGKGSIIFNNAYIGFLTKQANVCVSYFFILSGFVMIIAYKNKSHIKIFEYLKNRFARIYPIYLLGLFLVIISLLISPQQINLQDFYLNFFMIQAWIPAKALTLNYPGWSLSVELLFYLIFPFLFNLVYKKISIKTITVFILAFWIISQIILHLMIPVNPIEGFPLSTEDLYYFPLMHLNEFLIGNLAGIYFVKKSTQHRNLDWQIVLTITVIIGALKLPFGLIYNNGLLALLFIPLIVLISLNNGKLTTIFSSKFFIFLGEISFGIYILQYPIWVWISDYRLEKYFQINKTEDFSLAFFIRLFVLIVIAGISYRFFEIPIRKKIKNFSSI